MAVPKLRFKEFGSEYITTTFEKLEGFSIQSGKSDSKEDSGEFPFYGSTGVIGYKDSYDYCDEAILIARVGANAGSLYQVKGKYSVSDNTLMLCTSDKTNLNYLRELLIKFNLNQLVFGTGQPLVTGGMIKKVSIAIPSLEEQTKIASFLSAVDEKISQLTQKHALLSQYKQGMMQKLFSQQIRFKADDGSEFGEWEELKFKEVIKIKYGKDHKKLDDGDIPVLGTGGIMRYVDSYLYDGESILIGRKGTIDKPQFISGKFWTVDTLFYTEIGKKILPKFAFQQLLLVNWLNLNEATGVPSLNTTSIGNIELKVPSLKEQTKIANFLSSIDQKIDVVAQQIEQTKQWKKGLLQQMFV